MRSVDLFPNFPIMDMNRNALWRNPVGVDEADLRRMTRFWGDESWRQAADPGIAARARDLADRMRENDGVGRTIEALLSAHDASRHPVAGVTTR